MSNIWTNDLLPPGVLAWYTEDDLDRDPMPVPGLYALCDEEDEPLYIGQSNDIKRRLNEHRKQGTKKFARIRYYPVYQFSERLRLEAILILCTRPQYNRAVNVGIRANGTCYDTTKATFARLSQAKRSKGGKARASKPRAKKGMD
jgi:excinuclease UvrABC nuclease subunit